MKHPLYYFLQHNFVLINNVQEYQFVFSSVQLIKRLKDSDRVLFLYLPTYSRPVGEIVFEITFRKTMFNSK